MHSYKIFVKEKGESPFLPVTKKKQTSNLDGNATRAFYEDVISTTSQAPVPPEPKRKKKKVEKKKVEEVSKINMFLAAQNNDIAALSSLIESGVNLNACDSFGWTMIMCAACSGAEETVKILLKAGASTNTPSGANSPGYDAQYLAAKHGHARIVRLLSGESPDPPKRKPSSRGLKTCYVCEICKESCTMSRRAHESSTTHLLAASKTNNTKTFYGIPDSNKGFQMLMRHGWDREKGLGPEGSGRKFPIKALKRPDRVGIGGKTIPKVQNESTSASPPSTSRDRRAFERNFRLEFS